ncbi:TauD/TfdA family dioxygenase [Pontixanthobacter aestiaquae]|uniref:SyrP protein n=1 Tax=Pontixanthobacter aestiaquae TaxID=1509367 RepID=A0A844ZAA4_9SPHN|nr:TauD/TfdA family dioxygenase [Pontixanthobacter aestiaquae]MDN3646219.1 TauD/TfdA family dioxygenase [Pontixanthobacter aestiaquae]MXO82789.1 SyrP protein [Pontixanthobacter aestiaquae]
MVDSPVDGFPHIVAGDGDLADYLVSHKPVIDTQLAASGAMLFRGFDVPSVGEFDAAVSAYGEPNFPYKESLSNAVRVNLTERVFTANEAPPTTSIHLHHEMAQTPIYPSKLFFYCEIAPDKGGATPLCRSDILLTELAKAEPGLVNAFEMLGVKYTNVMPGADDAGSGQGRSWRSTLGVEDRARAEERLSALGYSWAWDSDDTLRATTPVLPAVRALGGGRKSFFNQLIAAFRGWSDSRNDPSKSVTFGDGMPITGTDMDTAIALSDALSYDHQWQAGDVVLVDNFTVMHGRKPFEGKRKVLASLIQ